MFFMSIYGCANTTTVNDKTALGPSVGEGVWCGSEFFGDCFLCE